MNTSIKGRRGEQMALEYMYGLGHRLVDRNYHTRTGEIDLITEHAHRLHFVEVKAWRNSMENLEFSINRHKQSRIYRTAMDFLARNAVFSEYEKQFDVVYIQEGDHAVRYIPQAFEGGAR